VGGGGGGYSPLVKRFSQELNPGGSEGGVRSSQGGRKKKRQIKGYKTGKRKKAILAP